MQSTFSVRCHVRRGVGLLSEATAGGHTPCHSSRHIRHIPATQRCTNLGCLQRQPGPNSPKKDFQSLLTYPILHALRVMLELFLASWCWQGKRLTGGTRDGGEPTSPLGLYLYSPVCKSAPSPGTLLSWYVNKGLLSTAPKLCIHSADFVWLKTFNNVASFLV